MSVLTVIRVGWYHGTAIPLEVKKLLGIDENDEIERVIEENKIERIRWRLRGGVEDMVKALTMVMRMDSSSQRSGGRGGGSFTTESLALQGGEEVSSIGIDVLAIVVSSDDSSIFWRM
ncbi:MAG: hypothetical protein QXQ57_04815 [Sulfolobales archaeon]